MPLRWSIWNASMKHSPLFLLPSTEQILETRYNSYLNLSVCKQSWVTGTFWVRPPRPPPVASQQLGGPPAANHAKWEWSPCRRSCLHKSARGMPRSARGTSSGSPTPQPVLSGKSISASACPTCPLLKWGMPAVRGCTSALNYMLPLQVISLDWCTEFIDS